MLETDPKPMEKGWVFVVNTIRKMNSFKGNNQERYLLLSHDLS